MLSRRSYPAYVTGRRQEALGSAMKAIGSNAASIRGDIAKFVDLDRERYSQFRNCCR
jgi:hypothetical protein